MARPGESTTARLEFDERAFAYWDPGSPDYGVLQERLRVGPFEGQAAPGGRLGWRVDTDR